MSFTGRAGFFGPLAAYQGSYHPSVYAKYSRGGGSQNAVGTLGKAFAYKRPQLADGGGIDEPNPYSEPPRNDLSNDYHQGHTTGRDAVSYSWGKVSPHFKNDGAEVTPHGHNEVTPRRLAQGGKAQMTPAWKDRPFAVSQNTKAGHGLKIHAPHSGEGLVMNIHLGPVGPHAISLSHSGAVNVMNVERAASRALQGDAPPSPFPVPAVPAVIPMGARGQQGTH
jgi:hypothetical protein